MLLVDRVTGEVRRTEATFGSETPKDAGPVRTTLDARWQAAAEQALEKTGGKNAALVALRVDDGEILAVANSPADGFNRAVSGTYAPGSTWKIVTSSALLLKGAVAPDDVVDCPRYLTVGKRFQNVETSAHPGATFRKAFTESCNTAFIGLRAGSATASSERSRSGTTGSARPGTWASPRTTGPCPSRATLRRRPRR